MNGLVTYLRERFPLPAVAAVALGTASMLVGFVSRFEPTGRYFGVTALVALMFFAFLLRLRVTDEFKDSAHDTANYPNRPVQRGVIARSTLVLVGVVALAVELGAAFGAGALIGNPGAIVWYLPVLGYSALTGVEFFAATWLERHFTIYFISHQLLSVWFAVWAIALVGAPLSFPITYAAEGFVFAMAVFEIVRKFEVRIGTDGKPVADTYPTAWGRGRAIVVLAIFVFIVGERFALASGNPAVEIVGVAAVLGIAALRNSDNAVRGIAMLSFFLTAIVEFLT